MRMDSTDSAAPTLISRTARWIDGGGTAAGAPFGGMPLGPDGMLPYGADGYGSAGPGGTSLDMVELPTVEMIGLSLPEGSGEPVRAGGVRRGAPGAKLQVRGPGGGPPHRA